MACGKRTRIKNLLVTAQSGNTWEAPTAAENWRLDEGFIAQATPEQIERNILKSSFTPEVDLVGIKVATMTGVSEMYGADYSDGTTKPWFNDAFNSIQLMETQVFAIPVSAIASNFVHNEIVTDTGTGVGRVLVPTKSDDTNIYIEATTPTFVAGALTGSIAGSATGTGVEVAAGWSYKFDSTQCIRLSARAEEDELISEMENIVPTLSITCDAGNIPKINYELSGVIRNDGTEDRWRRDGSMTDLTGLRSEVIPPRFIGGRLLLGDFTPVVDSTLTVDPAVTKKLRVDANHPNGAEGYVLTGRDGILSYRIATPTEAELDIYTDWFAANAVSSEFVFDGGQNNTFWFFAPTSRYQNVTDADDEGEMKQELEFSMTGQDDEELEIVCI